MRPDRNRPTPPGVTRRPLAVILTAALLLAGCAGSDLREEATPPLPDAFTASGEKTMAAQWWQDLDDPQLHDLIDQALAGNLSLGAARARLRQAEAVARREGAGQLPEVNARASADQDRRDDNPATEVYGVGLAASYEVDLWGRVRASHDAAAFETEASRADLQAAAITLTAQVARTWYARVEAQAQLDLLERQLAASRKTLDLVERRFRTGHATAADRHRQRREVEQRHAEHALARARLALRDHELALLLGQPATRFQAPTGELVSPGPLPATGLPGELIQRRPDLQRRFHQLQAADARAAAAVANRFPRLDLSASLTGQAASASELVATWITNLSGQLILPLIDGGSRRAEVARSRAATDEATLNYAEAVLTAVGEVEDALVREAQQRDYLERRRREVAEAKQLLEHSQRRYRFGEADHLAVLDAENGFFSAQRALLEGQREALDYRIDLYRALAGGWSGLMDDEAPDPLATLKAAEPGSEDSAP